MHEGVLFRKNNFWRNDSCENLDNFSLIRLLYMHRWCLHGLINSYYSFWWNNLILCRYNADTLDVVQTVVYGFCICMDSAFMGRSTPTTAFDIRRIKSFKSFSPDIVSNLLEGQALVFNDQIPQNGITLELLEKQEIMEVSFGADIQSGSNPDSPVYVEVLNKGGDVVQTVVCLLSLYFNLACSSL